MSKSTSSGARRNPPPRPTRPRTPRGIEASPLARVDARYHAPIFIGVILLSLLVFFGGVIFGDKLFISSDFLSWESFRPYLDAMAEKGQLPLWIPYIFSGMPGFSALLVTGDRWWDLTMKIIYSAEYVFGFINYPVMRVVMHYFIYGLGMYLLMRSKKAARSTAVFVALAAMFSTWIIIYIMIGHNTKIMVLMTFPYIFLCLEKLIGRWSLLYTGLLIIAVHVLWEASHMQTAFYGAMAVGIYLLFELVAALISGKNLVGVLRAAALVAIAAAVTYGMGLDRTAAVQEYLPYSTRGAPALSPSQSDLAGEGGGHGYGYATQWSFSPGEMITYLIPSYYGWGKLHYTGPETGGQEQQVPTYWGQMPFTDAGHYMGIAVLILGLFGAWMHRRHRFAQAMMVVGFFGLLLSFGSTFPVIYDLFYNYFPRFSSFRAPSQSLVLLEFAFPILAGFGIESLISLRRAGENPQVSKSLLWGAIGMGVFFLIGLVGTGAMKDGYMAAMSASPNTAQLPATIQEFVFNTMRTDWIFSGLLGLGTMLLMYYYMRGRVTSTVLKVALLTILIVDLWRLGYRSMDTQPADVARQAHARTDVDDFLATDTSEFRILDFTTESPNYPAYHFQSHILGYHAAKLRSYQDFLDYTDGTRPGDTSGNLPIRFAGGTQNGQPVPAPASEQLAWNLLSTKYVIAEGLLADGLEPVFQSQQKKAVVFRNPHALPRAWFVNRVEVAEPRQILERIRDNGFDPRDVAYIQSALATQVQPVGTTPAAQPAPADTANRAGTAGRTDSAATPIAPVPQTSVGPGRADVTVFEPHRVVLDVDAPGDNFLVISEIHYPPGWSATIDGKPAELVQTNYILRGLVVPKGRHTIEMLYSEPSIESGKWISLALNLATFGLVIAGFMMERRRDENPDPRHEAPTIEEDDV